MKKYLVFNRVTEQYEERYEDRVNGLSYLHLDIIEEIK